MSDGDDAQLLADYAVCREIMFAASKNYSFASRVLPRGRLHHVEALYALLRVGDDRVDVSSGEFGSALDAINDWETRYWEAFAQGRADHPVLRAYLNTARACDIPPETMRPYFRSMREDLTITRFDTFVDVIRYMEGSALPVGRAMTHILGVRAPYTFEEALPRADSLAVAMQLSNFWRDIAEDWARGRIYLPLEDMRRFGVTEDDLGRGQVTPAFAALLEFEIARTETYYQHAQSGIKHLAVGRWGGDERPVHLSRHLARYSPPSLRRVQRSHRGYPSGEVRLHRTRFVRTVEQQPSSGLGAVSMPSRAVGNVKTGNSPYLDDHC